jgi:hypothetical protein
MQSFSAQWVEIGMVAAGALGLIVVLAPSLGEKPKRTRDGWQFPVKFSYLLLFWSGFAAGIGSVTFAGERLLAFGAANRFGWLCFSIGFALVLLVLAKWPEPLTFDCEGLLEQGSPASRILWRNLSHVREYDIGRDHGIVIHDVYGKQLVVAAMKYRSAQVLDVLLELHPIPLNALEDELAPVSILKAELPE